MSYQILIGQRTEDISDPDAPQITAESVELDIAPESAGQSGRKNERHHSNHFMGEMMVNFGLENWWLDKFNQIGAGYGHLRVTDKIIDIFKSIELRNEDYRSELEFFQFWLTWAKQNCSNPVIVIL